MSAAVKVLPELTLDEQIRKCERSWKYWDYVRTEGQRVAKGAEIRLHDVDEKLKRLRALKRQQRASVTQTAQDSADAPLLQP